MSAAVEQTELLGDVRRGVRIARRAQGQEIVFVAGRADAPASVWPAACLAGPNLWASLWNFATDAMSSSEVEVSLPSSKQRTWT